MNLKSDLPLSEAYLKTSGEAASEEILNESASPSVPAKAND